jgi:integrase/recombinase XerD
MNLQELKAQGVALYTVCNRALELLAVMLALAPDRDWKWLRACVIALDQAAAEAADHSLPPLLVADIIERAHRELRRRALPPTSRKEAVAWRDWFMVAFLCLLPLRLKNFSALRLAVHVRKVGGQWRVDVPGSEIKTRRPYSAFVPHELVPWLEQYLDPVRPQLQRGSSSSELWLTRTGGPLAEHTIYLRITRLMARAFGAAVHPHAFRQIFATSVSMSDARSMDGARDSRPRH